MEKINLGKLVSKALHVPNVDGYPVYGRVDYELEGRSSNWYKKLKESNNSPSNIRRVFITLDGVFLSFYKSVGSLGRNTFVKYDKDLRECIKNGAEFTGHIFKSFDTEWVLSNIEELYVDQIILLGTEYFGAESIPMVNILGQATDEYLDLTKYNRLLMIGYKSDLISIVRGLTTNILYLTRLNDIGKHFFTEHKDIVLQMTKMQVSKDLYNIKFTCKTGTYSYDLNDLDERFEFYIRQLKDKYLGVNNVTTKGDILDERNKLINKLLMDLHHITNVGALHKYMNLLTFGLKAEEKEELLGLMLENLRDSELKINLGKLKGKL